MPYKSRLATTSDVDRLRAILSPALLTESFEALWQRVEVATDIRELADMAIQLYASWIVYRSLWDDVGYSTYVDIINGDEYATPELAPPDVKLRYMNYERRWKSEREFIGWMSRRIPAGTFWYRHSQIMKEIRLRNAADSNGDISEGEFAHIVEGVVTSHVIGSDIARAAFEWRNQPSKASVILGVNREVAGRMIDGDLPEDEEECIKVVADAVIEEIDGYRDRINLGERKSDVIGDMRSKIMRHPVISMNYNTAGELIIRYQPVEYSDDGMEVQMPRRLTVKFISDTGEVLDFCDIPSGVQDWIANLIRIRNF